MPNSQKVGIATIVMAGCAMAEGREPWARALHRHILIG
jgi:hypothetical protein